MEAQEHEPNWKNMVFYGVAWFIACGLLVLAMLSTIEFINSILVRIAENITDLAKQLNFGRTRTAISEGMYFVGGISAVGLAVWFEYYFRKGEKVGKLFQRVAKTLLIEVAIIVIANVGIIAIQLF